MNPFHQKIESIQYNSAIAITGTIRCTSSKKLYHELGLESLKSRRCPGKFACATEYIRINHLLICII